MDIREFLKGLVTAKYAAVDTETTGGDIRDGRGYLMGLSIAYNDRSEYFPFRHSAGENLDPEWAEVIGVSLSHVPNIIFHNAKFDLVSLKTIGIDITSRFYDTMLMSHWIDENLQSKALDWLGQRFLHEGKARSAEFNAVKAAVGWGGIPVEVMREYAEQDASLTLKLFHKFYPEFKKQGFEGELWSKEQEFIRLIVRMESNGILVDTDLCAKQAFTAKMTMQGIAEELGFNPGSPKQLGEYMSDVLGFPVVATTPAGKASYNKQAMAIYDIMLEELGNDTAKLITEYRGWQKADAVAYSGYPTLLSPDGRLRPNYKLHGTVTGRMSCEQPNLQQIPRSSSKEWDGSLKSCFIAKPGYELWEADYSQLELRLGASYAGEQNLIEEFEKPESDVFTRMAGELGFSRGDTKTLTYTIQYGGGVKRISDVFKVDSDRAREIRNDYFRVFPGFRDITAVASRKAEKNGYVKLWSGRRRHFADPQTESFKAFNSVIQGGAAEIVKRAMLRLSVSGLSDYMLLQVHDSVVFELHSDMVSDAIPQIRECMERVEPDFGVRFAVDIHRWGG